MQLLRVGEYDLLCSPVKTLHPVQQPSLGNGGSVQAVGAGGAAAAYCEEVEVFPSFQSREFSGCVRSEAVTASAFRSQSLRDRN